MAAKRKQDEKHLKQLREIVSLVNNKTCFDCHQRGPTYVNMTIGSFVCTSCSGILRGLNPPHRVKSISMTSFTPEEMEFLKSRGNDFCRQVWLGLYDTRSRMEPDSKDENKIRDFMTQKYEKKRWYVAPTEAMYDEARKQNTPVGKPEQKNNRSNITNRGMLPITQIKPPGGGEHKPVTVPVSQPNATSLQKLAQQSQNAQNSTQGAPSATTQSRGRGGLDLLGDLGGDPFAGPTSNTTAPPSGGGFADFANFGGNVAPPPQQNTAFPQSQSGGFIQPVGGSQTQQTQAAPASSSSSAGFAAFNTSTSLTTTSMSNQDKYAALADLDNVFGGGSGVSWDGQVGVAPSTGGGIQQSSSSGNIWGSTGSAPTSSQTSIPTGLPNSTSMPNAGFVSAGGNPFGGQSSAAAPAPAASIGNPFMAAQAGGPVPGPAAGAFAQFGQQSTTLSTASVASPQGHFGMQNGGFGVPQQPQPNPAAAPGGWGAFGTGPPTSAPPAYPGTAGGIPLSQAQAQGLGFGVPAGASQFGKPAVAPQMGQAAFTQPQAPPQQQFGAWPSQPAAGGNPFMTAAGGPGQSIPPRGTSSTNPFL